jgi:hypothetical protein
MAETRHRDDQDNLAPNETPTEAYTVLNASFSYRFFTGAQVYDVILRGRNLTDEEVRDHTSFVKDIVPLPGRDVSVSLRWISERVSARRRRSYIYRGARVHRRGQTSRSRVALPAPVTDRWRDGCGLTEALLIAAGE